MTRRQTVPTTSQGKIRIAFLITELAPGGAEKAFAQLVLGIDRERFEPVVYSLSTRGCDEKGSLAPLLRSNGIETIEFGLESSVDLFGTFKRLRTCLKAQSPLILQSFMFHANVLGRIAARSVGTPLICSGVRVAERDSPFRLFLDRATGFWADVWVCVGESVAEFTRTVGKISREKVVSIPNGVCVREENGVVAVVTSGAVSSQIDVCSSSVKGERSIPRSFGTRKRFIAVGRLTKQKGFDWLVDHAKEWLTDRVSEEWELWIVGDGEERETLRRRTFELGLDDRIFFPGWRSDVARLVAESEIFLLSSRWEGMPNVLLEAAALGKPCVCAKVEGVAEILGDGTERQACSWGDVDAWKEKIDALIADGTLRDEIGRKNQERVLAEFTVERTTQKYESLWIEKLRTKGIDV